MGRSPMVTNRRTEMVQALIELVADGGMEAATVRRVANRAGVSIGAVQHHFPTKTTMLVAAANELFARTAARMTEVNAGASDEQRLRTTASWLIPPSPDDQLARVWLSLATLAVFDDEAGAVYRQQWQRVRGGVADLLHRARPRHAAASVHTAATALLGLCDGLAVAVLAEPHQVTPEEARKIVDQWVDDWLRARHR